MTQEVSAEERGGAPPDEEHLPSGSSDRPPGRKERVLHTRVPAVLERELKRFAENLRVPVSNLVRAILEDAVSVADAATENVEARLRRAAAHLEKERERLKSRIARDPLDGVVAFQEVTLAVPASCAVCAKTLGKGSVAFFGVREDSASTAGPRPFVCEACRG